jgi:hypothetical protein
MSSILRSAGLVLLLVAVPVLAQDKDKEDRKANPRNGQELTPLVLAGEATGRITRVNSGTSLTLEVALPTAQPMVRSRSALRQALTRASTSRKQFTLDVADDVQVRTMQLPVQFDDKGKPKKYTSDELKELRGPNRNLPGYKSDYDSLKTGQIITVAFRRPQHTGSAPSKEGDKDKEKEKEKEKKAEADATPRVSLIVILSDGDSAAAARKDDGSDKKKK